jgi:hypothetical protein
MAVQDEERIIAALEKGAPSKVSRKTGNGGSIVHWQGGENAP